MKYIQELRIIQRHKVITYFEIGKLLNEAGGKYGDNVIDEYSKKLIVEVGKKHFCHRRLIADWIELNTGIIIPEISITENGIIKYEKVYDLKPKIKKLINKM